MDRLSTNGEMVSQIDLRNVPHSSFDLRNHNFLSGKLGKLIVTRCDEVYPGDRLKGNVQNVVNFEPLAAPLMGTMVDKQESFYVPYSVVWKNAHNFFTGKKGFNKPMPSVSPRDVFNAYNSYDLLVSYKTIYDKLSDDIIGITAFLADWSNYDKANDLYHELCDLFWTSYQATYEISSIVDLFKPFQDYYKKHFNIDSYSSFTNFEDSANNEFYSVFYDALAQDPTSSVGRQKMDDFFNFLCDFIEYQYNFFFGVSTHLDYMGWPVMDNWHDFCFNNVLSTNQINQLIDDNEYYDWPLSSQVSLFSIFHTIADPGVFTREVDPFPKDEDLFSQIKLNFLFFRAAYVVWYWNYRDELLETDALDPESDDFLADTCNDLQIVMCTLLRVRCWYKDTFTTSLTNTGDGNLIVPTNAFENDVVFAYYDDSNKLINTSDYHSAINAGAMVCRVKSGNYSYDIPMNYISSGFNSESITNAQTPGLSLDLFDRVSRLRRFIQKKLILGYEYDDVIWSNFMVKLSNVRMRIPELLSRGRDVVQINTVVNNTNTTEQIAGDKTAVAWSNGQGSHIDYFVEEHGVYLSYLTILPIQSYAGGLSRKYCKLKPFDFMWPDFATMGMDAVYNYELSAPRGSYAKSGLNDSTALQVFGYQGRYYDLKSKLDEEHGRLRTDLNYLTFSREWNMENKPKLNYIFVHCWPSVNPFVVGDDDDCFRADISHDIDFYRRLPVPSEMV